MVTHGGPEGRCKSEASSGFREAVWGEEKGELCSLPLSRCPEKPSPGGKERGTSVECWVSGSGRSIAIPVVQLGALKLQEGA